MVGTKTDRRARAEHLFRVVSSDRFLQKQGLGNEVPFFICAFDAEDGLSLGEDREDLILKRYFMLSLSLKLSKFAGKKAQ